MYSYGYKRVKDMDELFDAYVIHWDQIAQSSIQVMKNLLDANLAIQRVRELHSQEVRVDITTGKDFETGFCGHCWSYNGEYDTPYPCDTIKALDGEQ